MKFRSSVRKIASLLLCVSMTGALFTGCKKGDDMFPSIESPSVETTPEESTDDTDDQFDAGNIMQLKVALPYSDITVQCLAAMFYCKNNGLCGNAAETEFRRHTGNNPVGRNG